MSTPDELVAKAVGQTLSATPANVQTPADEAPELAREEDILAAFLRDVRKTGVVGEDAIAQTTYLALVSQKLGEPVSLVIKGGSSSGKSYVPKQTMAFVPADAVVVFSGMSEHALILSERSYKHRTIVIYEATALKERAEQRSGDQTAMFVRTLISEGHIVYDMSVRAKDGNWTTKHFEKEGPTNVIVTTTAAALHNENETRLLSLTTDDTPAHTRNVLLAIARRRKATAGVDFARWHELFRWMGNQTNEVDIPYAESLARAIPPVAIRLRRDFGAILSLIEAHAALHQATRPRDDRGRIVATEADYLAVRRLILGVVSAGVGATVAPIVRETVKVVQDLTGGDRDRGVSSAAVASALGLDTSAAWRRLAAASTSGYIENLEDRPRRAGRYVVGDPMPEDKLLLPDPVANLDDAGNRRPDGVCTFAPLSEEVSRDAE